MKIIVFLILALVSVSAGAMTMDVSRYGDSGFAGRKGEYWLDLSGKIEKGDAELLKQLIVREGGFPAFVRVSSSEGGNLMEAIIMGRLLRSGVTKISSFDYCNSSCFFLLVAGVERRISSNVGLHRPKFDDSYFASLSEGKSRALYKKMQKNIESYLEEMDVTKSLVNEMMTMPSNDLRTYRRTYGQGGKKDEAKELETIIGVYQPSFQEWLGAKCGRLSSEEKEILSLSGDLDRTKTMMDHYQNDPIWSPVYEDLYQEKYQELNVRIDANGGLLRFMEIIRLSKEISLCEQAVKKSVRRDAFKALLKSIVED